VEYLNVKGSLWKGNLPLRDILVDPIIEKGEDVTVHCSGNNKDYLLTNEDLKNPIYSINVKDFKNKYSKETHKLHYYPSNEIE